MRRKVSLLSFSVCFLFVFFIVFSVWANPAAAPVLVDARPTLQPACHP